MKFNEFLQNSNISKFPILHFLLVALVDFQFLPMEKVIVSSNPVTTEISPPPSTSSLYSYRSFYSKILPLTDAMITADWLKWSESGSRNERAAEDDVPFFCVPSLFARFVQPGNFEFRPAPSFMQDPSLPPGAIVSCTVLVLLSCLLTISERSGLLTVGVL